MMTAERKLLRRLHRLLVDLEFREKSNIEGLIEGSDMLTLKRIRRAMAAIKNAIDGDK